MFHKVNFDLLLSSEQSWCVVFSLLF